ncbi:MAG: NAD(P)-dependent oxidoreductase [Pirellulales bacterium]
MTTVKNSAGRFHVAWTGDFKADDGSPRFRERGVDVFAAYPHIEQSMFDEHRPVIGADQIGSAQGVIVLTPRVTAASLAASGDLLAIGRFGVGYDNVDVEACTSADVVAFITAGSVDRSVAEATIGWMLALTHHLRTKDALVRTGRWNDRSAYMGSELRDRTLGVVGLGGIGRKLVELLAGFGMNQPLAFDPLVNPAMAASLGVRLVELDELMAAADFVSIHCPLNHQTRGLVGRRQLGRMKSDAWLINTARGGIVDEQALYEVLRDRRIAGAAIDCFEGEPLTAPHRFAEFDHVLLAPHSIAWTHELFRDNGRAVCQGMVDLSLGRRPRGVLNPQVFDRPGLVRKWERLRVQL